MRLERRFGGRALGRPGVLPTVTGLEEVASGRSRRILQVLLWGSVAAAGVVPVCVKLVQPHNTWARPLVIGAFFLAAVLHTTVAAARRRAERTLPLMMAAALALFGTGAMTLALHPALRFPSIAELFFGAAYLCFTGFLVLDASGREAWTLQALLETGVVAGGIVSAAVFILVTPLAKNATGGNGSLLIALLYPLSDIVLITILLTQLATRRRPFDRRSTMLLAGFVTLAAVDASLPLGLASGGYAFSTLEDVIWAAALAALADSATRPSPPVSDSSDGLAAPAAVAAGLCAVVVLALDVGHGTSSLTHWPAVLTMVMSLGLLMTSLRDARSASEALRLSRTDDLTGLANRRAVISRLSASATDPCTLMLLDLNGFKAVNDAFGHPEGDRLLVRVGARLREAVPGADLVARLGGDEFAVICRGTAAADITGKADAILSAMGRPLAVADIGLTVSVAIGIAATPPLRNDDSDLLRRADVAMYRAKAAGGGYRWYDAKTDELSSDRLHLVEELRAGIADGQLRAYFQPQIDAVDGTLTAVEALIRWQHPRRGLLTPADFLPQARVAGLMLPLSLEMVRLCVRQTAAWVAAGHPLRVSLNVDPPELLSGAWGPALITEIHSSGLDPGLFTVELTEELLVSDPARAAERVRELALHGIDVSIDDYGTGYSGLAWLQTLPVRELKLALPFVSRILTDQRTRTIVESTVRLAAQLELRVVAEGIEDSATADVMSEMGVALLQGYFIGRPVLADALDRWRSTREQPALTTLPQARQPDRAKNARHGGP